ncbi:MAG: heat shock protein HtpX [Phycisphaerales bacterium]|nr:heat shock protein HtpX [Phycisphaerales bacterium]
MSSGDVCQPVESLDRPGLTPGVVTSLSHSAADAGRILAAVEVRVPHVKPPAAYGATVAAVAASMVALAAAYVGLAAFMGWLVSWHAVQAVTSFAYGPYFVFHVPMALLGALLLLFLVKPVFFRSKGRDDGVVVLTPEAEPLLFAFVRKLCVATGSPVPASVEVDCDPNASARYRGGLFGLAGGRLVLRVGLPLVAATSVRQLAGVLGHEFGHFNQRGGMVGSYLIRRLTAFLAAVVFRRDRLDARLARMRHAPGAGSQLLYWVAAGLVEPMRGVLWLMVLAGEVLACSVLRRMEYDADHVEARVAGVRDFVETSRLLTFLGIAARQARGDLAAALDQRRLADDLPALIAANARGLAAHRDDLLRMLEADRTGWLDTHPSHADRVRNVESTGAAGLVGCDLPAPGLFADFPGLCRRATEAFYCGAMGEAAWAEARERNTLTATADLAGERSGQRQAARALRRYCRGRIVSFRPVLPAADAVLPVDDVAAAAAELEAVRTDVARAAEPLGPTVDQYEAAAAALPVARSEVGLCALFGAGHAKARAIGRKAVAERNRHEPVVVRGAAQLAAFEREAARRLTIALRLLRDDDVCDRARALVDPLPDDPRPELARLADLCQHLRAAQPTVEALRELAVTLRVHLSAYNPDAPYPPLVNRILGADADAIARLTELRQALASVPYPFAHGTAGVTVGTTLVGQVPAADDPVDVQGCAAAAVEQYYELTFRAVSVLAEWAERAELAVGLSPLPEPAAEEGAVPAAADGEASRDRRRYWFAYGARAAAGVALVSGLVWYSVAPPTLPTMPWETAGASDYRGRPAGFSPAVGRYAHYTPLPPTTYAPAAHGHQPWQPPAYFPQPYNPGRPGYPGQPNVQPGRPGQNRNDPNSSRGYNPQPSPPNRSGGPGYNPQPRGPGPGGGGYRPGGTGGGGYSPGGGSRGR